MIDVVVVDYGTPDLARRCVASLDSPLFSSIELVDARARGWSYARSVNWSLEAGSAPYVLALNADTRMLEVPNVIVEIFEEQPDVAVIGPRQVTDHDLITHAGIFGSNVRPEHRFWMTPLASVDRECRERTLDCITVSGAVYFARRSVWEDLGGFLETHLMYFEETAFSYLARHRGHRVIFTGATTWVHDYNSSPYPGSKAELAAKSQQIFRRFCHERGIECN